MNKIDKLRLAAQQATPGPWSFWRGWVAADIDNDGAVIVAERPTPSGGKYQARVDANFEFIAAANPAVIAELLDHLEAVEKERDALRAELSKQQTLTVAAQHIAEVAQKRANHLQAKIETMEEQEPGKGDDIPCVRCGALALDTGLECNECGFDNYEAVTGKPFSATQEAKP